MQEQVSASLQQMSELSVPGNTPSLDQVREKIEQRYANALGSANCTQLRFGPDGRGGGVEHQVASHARLEQIRASMGELPKGRVDDLAVVGEEEAAGRSRAGPTSPCGWPSWPAMKPATPFRCSPWQPDSSTPVTRQPSSRGSGGPTPIWVRWRSRSSRDWRLLPTTMTATPAPN